jgi:antibiotic biosynthesis monooxygenase (ABM) superfamily enzyme
LEKAWAYTLGDIALSGTVLLLEIVVVALVAYWLLPAALGGPP